MLILKMLSTFKSYLAEQFRSDPNVYISSSHIRKHLIEISDNTKILEIEKYDKDELLQRIDEMHIGPNTQKIKEVITSDTYARDFLPNKFDIHFMDKCCNSKLYIHNKSIPQSEYCLAVVVDQTCNSNL